MDFKSKAEQVAAGAGVKFRTMQLNPKLFGYDKNGNPKTIPVVDRERFIVVWLGQFSNNFIVRLGFIVLVLGSFFFTGWDFILFRVLGFGFIVFGYEMKQRKLEAAITEKHINGKGEA